MWNITEALLHNMNQTFGSYFWKWVRHSIKVKTYRLVPVLSLSVCVRGLTNVIIYSN